MYYINYYYYYYYFDWNYIMRMCFNNYLVFIIITIFDKHLNLIIINLY
jgi:hypothetical protein